MLIAHSNETARPIFKSEDQLFTLYQGDCNEILPQFENQFDLIFADPPYFLSNDGLSIQSGKIVSVNKGDWDKEDGIDDIDEFNYQWINNAKKALKNTGSLLISGTYHNIFSLGRILQKLDFKILNLITWKKTNPPPNFSCRYLTHSAEQTTQKPLALLVCLLLMASDGNSLIGDPFSGSSTTGIAANLLKREFIGIEKESEFIKISMDRKIELDARFKEIRSKIKDLNLQ
ncbi:site-specific DNA-methyltransferase [Helicobacter pylori]